MAVFAVGINRPDDRFALCVTVIRSDRNVGVNDYVHINVIEVGEAGGSVHRSPLIAESRRLKDAAAGVPEVGAAGQPQRVGFRMNSETRVRMQSEYAEPVDVILHVEKREAGIGAGRRH